MVLYTQQLLQASDLARKQEVSMPLNQFSDLNNKAFWDVDAMSDEELSQSFELLNEKMTIIYKFVLRYNDYINTRQKYTSEEALTMLEAHLLTDICDVENSTVTSLANAWGRSVSATSQTVRKLMQKGLVVRENSKENGKVFYMKPTEKGARISDVHKRYDTLDTIKTVRSLLRTLSFEEVDTMFQAIAQYSTLLQTKQDKK